MFLVILYPIGSSPCYKKEIDKLRKTSMRSVVYEGRSEGMKLCHLKLCILLADSSVLDKSMAIVIGPTPPGTGVIAEATVQASS